MAKWEGSVTRRDALKSLGGLMLGSALPATGLAAELNPQQAGATRMRDRSASDRPNILWITGEGVPLSVLSCYGSKLMSTPNIDRLANEGMRFENSFVTNALCGPSRATLITGTYSHINGEYNNPGTGRVGLNQYHDHFDPSQPVIPRILKQQGYQTGLVGKWHIPVNPGDVGFDTYVFREGAGGPYYNPNWLGNPSFGSKVIEKQNRPGYGTDVVTDIAIDQMKQFKKPFFLMLQYFNDHRPFEPPHKYAHLYDGVRIPEPGTFWDDYRFRASPAREARMRVGFMPDYHPSPSLTERQRQQWNYQQFLAHFLSTMRSQDDNIGRLLEYLDKSGLAQNTIVIYTSDHGFFLGDHGWLDKRFMYEQALRVPWIIRYPGRVKAGTVRPEWVVNIDNAPTVLDLVGLPIPAVMQGKSLKPLVDGQPAPADWRKSMYYHYYEFGGNHWVEPHYGIRTDRYKLISYYGINEWELFDLDRDPDEMESLIEWSGYKVKPDYADVLQGLVTQLGQLREQYKDSSGQPVHFWPTSLYD